MPRPHFAYLFERFPSFTQTFCAREVQELQRQGVRLRLYSIRSTESETVRHFPEDLLRQVTVLPPPAELVKEVEEMKSRRELPQAVVLTLRHWGNRPDKARVYEAAWTGYQLKAAGVQHVHTHFAGMAARTAWWIRQFYGLSYSFTGHANDLFCPDESTTLHLPRLVEDAAVVIAVSEFTAGWLRERFPQAAPRIHRVYNSMDPEAVAGLAAGVIKADPPLICSVGRLIPKKGFPDLIRACAVLRDRGVPFQCRITGAGPMEGELLDLIRQFGLESRVRLEGAGSQEEIARMLGEARVFALLCVPEPEGGMDVLPTVVMEAMAAGLPCVSTPIAGVPEMVLEEKTGLLTAVGEPVAAADALQRLLQDPALAQTWGQRGLDWMKENFDQTLTTAQLREVLTAHGRVDGPPANVRLAAAHFRQWLRRWSAPVRALRPRKEAVFPG